MRKKLKSRKSRKSRNSGNGFSGQDVANYMWEEHEMDNWNMPNRSALRKTLKSVTGRGKGTTRCKGTIQTGRRCKNKVAGRRKWCGVHSR